MSGHDSLFAKIKIKSEDDSNFSEMLAQIGISIEKKHLEIVIEKMETILFLSNDGW